MTSTQNLLQDSDKSTNTLESGYHSDTNEVVENWQVQTEKASKKKKSQRNLGLENKGFESDNEHVSTASQHKVQVHQTLTEGKKASRQTTTKAEHRDNKRRHSYAGRSFADSAKVVDSGARNTSATRRRSQSTSEDDLRRRACLNSMRLRRVSSSNQQRPFSEVDMSFDDDVFHDYDSGTETRKKSEGNSYGERQETRDKRKDYAMGSVCSTVELENRKLNEYSKRLSYALQERAILEEELNTLRQAASVPRLSVNENWKSSPKIHFRNEKLNSVRRKSRESEDKKLSFEQLRQMQTERSRRLPDVPQTFISGKNEFLDEIPCTFEKNAQSLPLATNTENSPLFLRQKDGNDRFKERTQLAPEKKSESMSQRDLTNASPKNFGEERRRNDRFFLSEQEKEKRARRIADLVSDLWEKLLQGEKFHGDNEPSGGKTHSTIAERESPDKTARSDDQGSFSSGEYQFTDELNAKAKTREKEQKDRIAKLAEHSGPSTSGFQESHAKVGKGTILARSESESNIAHTDAFKRNQRRPLRYKRGSSAAESLIGAARPSISRISDAKPDEVYQDLSQFSDASAGPDEQEETHMPQEVQPEKKSNRLPPKAPTKEFGIRSTEVVSQNHSKWFDYMLPPGMRRERKERQPKDLRATQSLQQDKGPSLQEKLRYYQELQEQRSRDQNAFDLADAYMAAQHTEEEEELRRQAASKAAILRREASHLLWEAMNLERICDPNARVRHVFTPC